MKFLRYLSLYLAAAFYFVLFNGLLDRLFIWIENKDSLHVIDPIRYIGFFLTLYTPWFLVFLIIYNVLVNELLRQKKETTKEVLLRYAIALFLGLFIGFAIGRGGISFYIGQYRPLKNILLFAFVMISLELTRDVITKLRYK